MFPVPLSPSARTQSISPEPYPDPVHPSSSSASYNSDPTVSTPALHLQIYFPLQSSPNSPCYLTLPSLDSAAQDV